MRGLYCAAHRLRKLAIVPYPVIAGLGFEPVALLGGQIDLLCEPLSVGLVGCLHRAKLSQS
jgi:hypothetical protein